MGIQMRMLSRSKKTQIISVILIAVALNAITFCFAFPEIFKPESSTLARDFSAYYIGEWRLFNNPTKIYVGGNLPGDYSISPSPQSFKYTPSFLILFAPFLALSYQNSFIAFDLFQLVLIPALAFLVYKMVKDKNLVLGAIAAVIILIQPLPTPPINQAALNLLHYRFYSLNPQSFSPNYFVSYELANAHVLQTVLLVGSLYFGFIRKPWFSALLFSFSIFDPRAAILALPLLLWYNRKKIMPFVVGAFSFIALTNLPFFFYQNIGLTFLRSEISGYIVTQMYPYDWIPIYAVVALTIIEVINNSKNTKISPILHQEKRESYKEE